MSKFTATIQIQRRADEALYLAVARSLIDEIRRGRLDAGTRLPGTRTLAAQLGLSRNTILCAYDELLAQGWLETRQARGTYVSELIPDPRPRARATRDRPRRRPSPGFAMHTLEGLADLLDVEGPGAGSLASGMPDYRLIPVDLLARAYRRALKQRGNQLLSYGDPRGEPSLRKELARMYAATRGLAITSDNVLITRGAQMALALAARILIRPGDRVAVERYGYRPLWDALRLAGARLVPVPVDDAGMQVQRLADLGPLRAVYLTPHHQYPTTALPAPDRRAWLLDWAQRKRCAILEDDYDHEFHFRGAPVLPLMSADRAGVVLYIGGFSKVLAPGIRIGCLVGPTDFIEQAATVRQTWDRQGDQPTEAAVAELLRSGEIPRHVRRMRRIYAARRTALLGALESELPGCLAIRVPAGGMSLWARILDGTDADEWADEAQRNGLEIHTARRFDIRNRKAPFLRLGFASSNESEIRAAVRELARIHRRLALKRRTARRASAGGAGPLPRSND